MNYHQPETFKDRLHEVIFEADTPAGKVFDIALLIIIVASVLNVLLESVESIGTAYRTYFDVSEWVFTIFFTIEYILRLYAVHKPIKYAKSFYGIIDLLAVLPSYIGLFIGTQTKYFVIIRALRLLRIFRIFKLTKFLRSAQLIVYALKESRAKIMVFLTFVILMVIILGSVIYLVEGDNDSGFTSIPQSIYWAVVTLTTVGYGDIAPTTPLGKFIAAAIMIIGYVVIAVPTGIVSMEMSKAVDNFSNTQSCRYCGKEGHDDDAKHCKYCGERL